MTRAYLTPERLRQLRRDLSVRESAILQTLSTVRIASAKQLERLHFSPDEQRQRRRLLQAMTDRRLIHRLDRSVGGRRSGSADHLFVLDIAGRRIVADGASGRAVHRPKTPGGAFIRHALEITEVYVGLVEADRLGQVELLEFLAESACWRSYQLPGGGWSSLRPDAYIKLGSGPFVDHWWLEIDLGTEAPSTLTRKINAVRSYWQSGAEAARRGVFPRTLWAVPDERRFQVVADICGRQPADSWALHQVTLLAGVVGLLTGAQP